jgi:hypothetical protein
MSALGGKLPLSLAASQNLEMRYGARKVRGQEWKAGIRCCHFPD